MSWRESFLSRFGPGAFGGVTFGRWIGILRDNGFAIDPPYFGRAAVVTAGSVQNSAQALFENLVYGRRVREAKVGPPVFILGIWRSGTTHLHNLLARDPRFAYPNNYQVCYPLTFLTTERTNARLVGFFVPEKRPQDNVSLGISEPQEDEFAFCSLTGRIKSMAWVFPRRADHYNRYLTFRDADAAEVAEWKAAMTTFVKKLSFKYGGRPLVLKSPGHTARIRLLLELFPDARFVHIHRNPFVVFQSTRHMLRAVAPWFALQRPDHADLDGRVLRQYREVYDTFFEERGLIPKGRYHDLGFEELEADPIGRLRATYEALDLPDFTQVEPAIARYLGSVAGYKKNVFPEFAPELRGRIVSECRRGFDEWDYPVNGLPDGR